MIGKRRVSNRDGEGAGSQSVTAGQGRGTARGTLRFDVEVCEAQALGREPIGSRSRRAAEFTASVATKLAIAQVVSQNVYDVRLHGKFDFARSLLCGTSLRILLKVDRVGHKTDVSAGFVAKDFAVDIRFARSNC